MARLPPAVEESKFQASKFQPIGNAHPTAATNPRCRKETPRNRGHLTPAAPSARLFRATGPSVMATAAGSSCSSYECLKSAARPPPRDFLVHVEAYLSCRDGVDKLLKISCYAARLALSVGPLPPASSARLKFFESSVGLSRKAFLLGKFIQSVNALRAHPHLPPPLVLLAYGGQGVYYFLEQFVWLAKAGLLPAHLLPRLQRLGAWVDLLGHVGSITIKLEEVVKMESSVKMRRKEGCGEESEVVRALRGKLLLKRMSVVQDLADVLMVLGDVTGAKGLLGSSTLMASAGLLSALISAHKNWNSC
ncbi:hypothetical protein GUJ93_ZPchr0013g36889 [Zizania palustris]|uniref:Uncharacterized protein n=1 Tax=Zizania palustris TaxID=103762 RepID=A0A8J5WZA4_ZIZPA|nr:hypothetical protein GUJ93_ZPchr0013g36889 [Zizania palustris]